MSATILASSPSPASSSAEPDGAAALALAWAQGLRPEPALSVADWADRHRMLSPRASAEPGRWRTDRTPYLGAIMAALSPAHPAQRIVFMKGAQVGGTEAGNNWLGFLIHHAPGPALAVQPTVELAKRFSRQRVATLIEETPALRERVTPARSRDSGNTVLTKEFPGGILVMTGADSAVGLRSLPARYLFLDEVEAYPPSADEEGDPVALAEARTLTFAHRRKIFLVSTPTIQGISRIEREYLASDQRSYFVPCPHCGAMQWLRFDRLRWDRGRPETAAYWCDACERRIDERHKAAMLPAGAWRPTALAGDPLTIGFHLSALYAPLGWLSWARIAALHEQARGAEETHRAFVNAVLGETWAEAGESPDWQRLHERREDWPLGVVPAGGLMLTAGADVQKDRIEVSIWAWGQEKTCWLVEHRVLIGEPGQPRVWQALSALLNESWRQASGVELHLEGLGIDSGFATQEVYGWVRAQPAARVFALKGVERGSALVGLPTAVDVSLGGRRLRRGAKVCTVAAGLAKLELFNHLRLPAPLDGEPFPPGYVHLPKVDGEYLKQLCAEQLVTRRDRRGYARREWQKVRERNEALDCYVYARAAAAILGLDRMTERHWQQRAANLGIPAEPPPVEPVFVPAPKGDPTPAAPAQPIRRATSWPDPQRSWLGRRSAGRSPWSR
jgi:phage terminase large subunit GpA-like protein